MLFRISFFRSVSQTKASCYLRDGDAALFGQLLFGLLAGIWVRQVGVEVLVQHLCGLLAEVASFAPDKDTARVQPSRR